MRHKLMKIHNVKWLALFSVEEDVSKAYRLKILILNNCMAKLISLNMQTKLHTTFRAYKLRLNFDVANTSDGPIMYKSMILCL